MVLAVIRKTGRIKQSGGEDLQAALGRQVNQHSVTFSSDYKFPWELGFFST